MKVLVTGCCGFIGFHLCKRLLDSKEIQLSGIDNLNDYYDINLKKNRLKILKQNKNFKFYKFDISDEKKLNENFKSNKYQFVVNLAAQAGVRYSIENPKQYFKSNLLGFFNILEASRSNKNTKHLIFASTSSVYGNNSKFPLKENYETSKPLTFYAASKKSNEVMAHSYSNIYKLPTTALRFFTVYGPYGRPDMALFKFTDSIIRGKKLELYNNGNHHRDFTYVDDIVESIIKLIPKPSKNIIPFEVYNLGSSKPIFLKKYLKIIENQLNKKAKIKNKKLQLGDVRKTHASTKKFNKEIGKIKVTKISTGVANFIKWYLIYHKKK